MKRRMAEFFEHYDLLLLPIDLQIIGAAWGEKNVLQTRYAYEKAMIRK